MEINKTTIESVANWLLETSSVYYDNALQDSEELLETNPKEFFEILKQTNTENKGKNMYVIMLKDSSKYNLIEAITNDYHKWIEEYNQDPALDEDEKYTLDDFIIIDIKPTIF